MVFTEETAAQVESLYRQHLNEAFQGILTFDPSGLKSRRAAGTRTPYVTLVYGGVHSLLDPAKLNAISSTMVE